MVTLDTTVIDLKKAIFVNLNRMHPDTQVRLLMFEMLLLMLMLMENIVTQVLTYQGEEMEEDEETMADYDIQVEWMKIYNVPT